jgi:hypothetical protein
MPNLFVVKTRARSTPRRRNLFPKKEDIQPWAIVILGIAMLAMVASVLFEK